MPYDPRPVSKGGNRGIDDEFSRQAPEGKFRVVGVDTFDGTDWVDGDYETLDLAKTRIQEKTKGESMLKYYIYDDTGKFVDSAGTF